MKKILFPLLLFISFAAVYQIKVGIKAGYNLSTIISNLDNTQLRYGFQAGGMLKFDLVPKIALQSELLYSLQGTSFDSQFDDENYPLNLHYLQVPVIAKIYITDNLNVIVGPSFNFLLNASNNETLDFLNPFIQDSFTNAEIAGALGPGYELSQFSIELRYDLSLTNINDIEFDDEKWRNHFF